MNFWLYFHVGTSSGSPSLDWQHTGNLMCNALTRIELDLSQRIDTETTTDHQDTELEVCECSKYKTEEKGDNRIYCQTVDHQDSMYVNFMWLNALNWISWVRGSKFAFWYFLNGLFFQIKFWYKILIGHCVLWDMVILLITSTHISEKLIFRKGFSLGVWAE